MPGQEGQDSEGKHSGTEATDAKFQNADGQNGVTEAEHQYGSASNIATVVADIIKRSALSGASNELWAHSDCRLNSQDLRTLALIGRLPTLQHAVNEFHKKSFSQQLGLLLVDLHPWNVCMTFNIRLSCLLGWLLITARLAGSAAAAALFLAAAQRLWGTFLAGQGDHRDCDCDSLWDVLPQNIVIAFVTSVVSQLPLMLLLRIETSGYRFVGEDDHTTSCVQQWLRRWGKEKIAIGAAAIMNIVLGYFLLLWTTANFQPVDDLKLMQVILLDFLMEVAFKPFFRGLAYVALVRTMLRCRHHMHEKVMKQLSESCKCVPSITERRNKLHQSEHMKTQKAAAVRDFSRNLTETLALADGWDQPDEIEQERTEDADISIPELPVIVYMHKVLSPAKKDDDKPRCSNPQCQSRIGFLKKSDMCPMCGMWLSTAPRVSKNSRVLPLTDLGTSGGTLL